MQTVVGIDFGGRYVQAAARDGDDRPAEALPLSAELGDFPALLHAQPDGPLAGNEAYWCCRHDEDNTLGAIRPLLGGPVDGGRSARELDRAGVAFAEALRASINERLGGRLFALRVAVPAWLDDERLSRLAGFLRAANMEPQAFVEAPAALLADEAVVADRPAKLFVNMGASSLSVALHRVDSPEPLWQWHDEEHIAEAFHSRLLEFLAEHFIATHRRDPRENPYSMQALFQVVEEGLRALRPGGGLSLAANLMGKEYAMAASRTGAGGVR